MYQTRLCAQVHLTNLQLAVSVCQAAPSSSEVNAFINQAERQPFGSAALTSEDPADASAYDENFNALLF